LSRLRIFLAFAALAGLATVLAACGGGGGSNDEKDPKAVLEEATFAGIKSADVEASVGVDVSGSEGGHVDVNLSGPFQSKGKGQLPELDMNVEASGSVKGEDVNFEGGLVLVPNKAYVDYEGDDYEVDPTTFSFVESAIEQAQRESGAESGTEGATACQKEAAGKLKLGDFVEGLSNDGSADVGGTETTKVSGDLDIPGAIDALTELAQLPACESQMQAAGPLPLSQLEEAKGEIEKALKSAHADVYVGEDGIVRRLTAEFTVEPSGSGESVEVEIDVSLNGVNEEQEISTPENAKPLNDLFEKLGVNPLELLQGAQGGQGLGGLLEQFGGSSGLGGSLPGGGSGEGGGGGASAGGGAGAAQQEYLECVQSASTPVDLQNCAKKLQ
jgi:hypothetical protein